MSKARTIFAVGYMIPICVGLVLGSGALLAWTKFDAIRSAKEDLYRRYKLDRTQIQLIAPELPKLQPRLGLLHALLGPDQYGAVGESFKAIESGIDPRVARRIGYRQMDAGEGAIAGMSIPFTGLSVTWNGKFSQVQAAVLQIEAERPNLVLTSLSAELESGRQTERTISLVEKYSALYATQPAPAAPAQP